MNLDAWNRGVDRRGLQIEQPDRRGADQNEPAVQPIRRHPALQNVLGRDVTRRIVFVEVDPELPVAVGRYFEAGHGDRPDAGVVDPHQYGAGTGDHAQHFHRQRRHQSALRLHDHRHAADNSVAFRIDGK